MTLEYAPRRTDGGGLASVLIVDDNRDTREMLTDYLSTCGFVVDTAANGFEAIDFAVHLHPSVILMDLMMPRMDGWEATCHLKADARTRDIPIVVMTANAQPGGRQVAQAAGCVCLITKPCNLDHLTEVLRRAIGQARQNPVAPEVDPSLN
jgi:two-component system, cell cycle response regulator DivK